MALVTLFDDDGELDAPATASLASKLVEAGIRGVVVAGTTGEAASLSADERIKLLEAVRAAVPAEVPVLAGTGAPSRRQAGELTAAAVGHGADAVLTLSLPGSLDLSGYYEAVADAAGGTPVLAYHYPAVSAPGIAVEVLMELPVEGVKDSSGDAARLLHEVDVWDRPVYTGSSALLSYAGPLGCAGAILSLANVEPERCIAAFAGDANAQRGLAPAHRAAHESFPRRLKEMVAERYGTPAVVRMG
ncbi:MAG: dihydrodipicolinate synthase family protein [Sporichthyaceae bacterium]|nr:dihydrodipicolinate synthase family protein [Sporichthyaceae bacterium]